MKFVRLAGKSDWYEWDEEHMHLCSYQDLYYPKAIDENSLEWIHAEVREYNNWHELYLHTGYNPLAEDYRASCCWLDPDGYCWRGDCHEVDAQYIIELIDGEYKKLDDDPADDLINRGWVKLSNWMFTYYCEYGYYNDITLYQYQTIQQWCDEHDLLISMVTRYYND